MGGVPCTRGAKGDNTNSAATTNGQSLRKRRHWFTAKSPFWRSRTRFSTQREIVRQALSLFETAKAPRTTVKAPFSWKEDGTVWRARYGRVDPADKERLLKVGEERRKQQAAAKQIFAKRAAAKA